MKVPQRVKRVRSAMRLFVKLNKRGIVPTYLLRYLARLALAFEIESILANDE